jgi:iron only hydrogenase large subunit-like protein
VVSHIHKVSLAIKDSQKKVIAVVSPYISSRIGEMFYDAGHDMASGKTVSMLRILDFDTVYDLNAIESTPYCPAVIRFAQQRFPQIAPSLYTPLERRPFEVIRSMNKNSGAFIVSITPCTAEKGEDGFADACLTTCELTAMFQKACVSRFTANEMWRNLESGSFDDFPVKRSSEHAAGKEKKYVYGLQNVAKTLSDIQNGKIRAGEAELFACPGGCKYGGGQPRAKKEWEANE